MGNQSELPRLVKGCCGDSSEPRGSHALIVFEDRDSAGLFAADVGATRRTRLVWECATSVWTW